MADALPHLHLAVLGHAQSGKSSVLGRLLAELGSLPASEVDRIKLDGHGNVKYAAVSRCWHSLDLDRAMHVTPAQSSRWPHFWAASGLWIVTNSGMGQAGV